MKRKNKDRDFINRLILNKIEFIRVYKMNKYILLDNDIRSGCTDIIKLYKQLVDYSAYDILNYIYIHKGLVNDFVDIGTTVIHVNIDITPKSLNAMTKKIKRMVVEYEEKTHA